MRPFDSPRKSLGTLDADATAQLITAAADVALVLDKKGIIKDMMLSPVDLAKSTGTDWIGKHFVDTVTIESRGKVEDMLRTAAGGTASRWRQVNHPLIEGSDLPVRYSALQIGSTGGVIAIGQDLRQQAVMQQRLVEAQASLEREYVRLRQVETRYRALFQVASEAVLIVDAPTLKVTEANPAAAQLLANGSRRTVGRAFSELFGPETAGMALDLLAAAQSMPRTDSVAVSSHGGRALLIAASMFRQEGSAYYLVRLRPQTPEADESRLREKSQVVQIVEHMPDSFVVADKDRRIVAANTAFLDMCELAREAQVRGEPLERWLGRVGVDIDVLIAHVREHGIIRRFATIVRGEFGAREDVEVSAVHVPDPNTPYYGLTLRKVERRSNEATAHATHRLPKSVEQFTELVGRVPLKDLVRETTDIVERLCIEAALELTKDNRASAAEMLGLSRQSFYVKMRRYGLGDLGEGDTDD
ncbi:MAG: transcriptional regulator PpsR [Hyphomicrobiaceae bacterium]|nr:transcriptional regulator PpsR [Hyphomicrobiaceae bacterium]